MHNFSFFWIYAKKNSRSTFRSLFEKRIGKILQSSKMPIFWECIEVGSKCVTSGARWRISMRPKRKKLKWLVHPLLIGHGLRDLIRCLETKSRLMAFPMQLIRECRIYIDFFRFKLLRWMMMMWHKALKTTLIHHNKLLFLVTEMKRRLMLHL
jgi:hypothetical protein